MVTPFLFLYTSFAIDFLAQKSRQKKIMRIILFSIVLVTALVYKHGIILVPQEKYKLEYYTPQPNYNKIYKKIIKNGFSDEDTIVSTIPLMDIIYLGRSDYAIPWSLTGRDEDTTFIGDTEVYSGAKKLKDKAGNRGIEKIKKLQQVGNVYVVLDSLASKRMGFDLWDDITDLGKEIAEDGKKDGVVVYIFPRNNKTEFDKK